MSDLDIVLRLAVGLTVGLVIGLERGWHERDIPEGSRVAGFRTFGLIGLTGSLAAVLVAAQLALIAGALSLGFVGLMITFRWITRGDLDIGATTEVAWLTTFGLGAVSGAGYLVPAVAGAVVSALLLNAKPVLHRWLRGINDREMSAALQLLLISAVVLPLLPDQAIGPFESLNPYRLWLMVVLTAGVSFAGYLAMKVMGSQRGVVVTGFAGGLVASTVTTLALLRHARSLNPTHHVSIAAGITAATAAMTVRTFVLAVAIYPRLWPDLIGPFGAAGTIAGAATFLLMRRTPQAEDIASTALQRNPLDLRSAIGFGTVLAVVMVLIELARSEFGSTSTYIVAALVALGDVDAVTLSLAEQAQLSLPHEVAVTGLLIALAVNTCVKIGLSAVLGPRAVAWPVTGALGAFLAAAAVVWLLAG